MLAFYFRLERTMIIFSDGMTTTFFLPLDGMLDDAGNCVCKMCNMCKWIKRLSIVQIIFGVVLLLEVK